MKHKNIDEKYFSMHPDLIEAYDQIQAYFVDDGIERNKGSSISPWPRHAPKRLDRPGPTRAIESRPGPFHRTGVRIYTTPAQRAQGLSLRLEIDGFQITIVQPPASKARGRHEP